MRKIEEFLPPGTQMSSPGGLSFEPRHVAAVEASENSHNGNPEVIIKYVGGQKSVLKFHRNIDGGSAKVYAIKQNIEEACK